jgi:hypothetical protein
LIIEKKRSINYYWISASKLYNYLNDDPLLDWLTLFGKNKGYKTDEQIEYEEYCKSLEIKDNNEDKLSFEDFLKNNNKYNFMKYILEQGVQYEQYILKTLKERFGNKIIDIENEFNFEKFQYDKKLEKTQELIKNNIPIIYQGLVCDPDTNTFGFPDLIIREDYFNKYFLNENIEILENNQSIQSQEDVQDKELYYNYYIIDIKYHTLDFKKDSNNIIPNPSQQQYISQMYLYTKGLRHLIHPSVIKCNLLDHKSYIIGRSWNFSSDTKISNTNSIGCIDFKKYEKVLEKVNKGLEWYKELKFKGNYWDPLNPSRYEMYPNMKNEKDNNWKKSKQIISEKIGEISMIWNCGTSIKIKAHANGVYSWNHPDFNILNYTIETETTKLTNEIVKINKQLVRLFDYDKNTKYEKNWREFHLKFERDYS